MNFDRLRFVAERAEVGEGREAILAVTIPEERGSFRRFCKALGDYNLTEFNYRMANDSAAHIFVGFQVRDRSDTAKLLAKLRLEGFDTLDLTEDEMAKLHLRHLVGGRSSIAREELLYRFEFPERPGELTRFLVAMHPDWNISLFHYRNHGADYGRILIGVEVPLAERGEWQAFLDRSEYLYWNETENPGYRLFLG
jgi:threonine dehydratase